VEAVSLFKEMRHMLYFPAGGYVNLRFYGAVQLKDPKKLFEKLERM
jgi:hypothetical protein